MPVSFSRSLRALDADSFGRLLVLLLVAGLLIAGWLTWAVLARVSIYARSTSARVESGRQAHPVEAAVEARVLVNRMELGAEVREGDVLVELDATGPRLALAEAKATLAAVGPQLAARRNELGIQASAQRADVQRTPLALAEARARFDEAGSAARLAQDHLARTRKLYDRGLVSQAELVKAQSDAEKLATAADAQHLAVSRIERESRAIESSARARVGTVEREIAALESDQLVLAARIAKLEHDIAVHVVRAPVGGRIAEVVPAPVGRQVKAGERLGAVVPAGELRLIAELPPADVLGRVRAGQRARFRLTGFPWMQYGQVPATVERVATEVQNGQVRVELSLHPLPGARVPLEHGLPGMVEIEVERVSPAALVLRAVGRWIDPEPGQR